MQIFAGKYAKMDSGNSFCRMYGNDTESMTMTMTMFKAGELSPVFFCANKQRKIEKETDFLLAE